MKSKPHSVLHNIQIAIPCQVDWQTMTGDEKVRSCQQCKLNVYNLSNMTTSEAETLIREKEGRLCVRLYRRTDGTVITKDCAFVLFKSGLVTALGGAAALFFNGYVAFALAITALTLVWFGYAKPQLETTLSQSFSTVVSQLDAHQGNIYVAPEKCKASK
jgi:hypothetical protein